jgi:hypothetical protein
MKLGICILTFFAIGITAAASETATVDRALQVSGPVSLDVRSDPGGIDIRVGTDSSVQVRAVIKPLYGQFDLGLAEANIQELQRNPPIEQIGNRIRVGYAKPELLKGVSVHFELQVPRETTVRAQTSSGGIKIDGVLGSVNAETSSGHTEISNIEGEVLVSGHSGAIVLRGVRGHVSVRSDSGGLQVMSIQGPVELQTASGRTEVSDIAGTLRSSTHSGSISVDNAKGNVIAANASGSIDAFQIAGPVQAYTLSGAIRISQTSAAPIRAQTHSGAITVDLASGQGYLIDAQSHSGKVSGPRNGSVASLADVHRLKAQLGSGGPLVDLDTRSSKIEIN